MSKYCLIYFNKDCRNLFNNESSNVTNCSTFIFNDHIDEGKFINIRSNRNQVPYSFRIDYNSKDSYWNYFTIWAKNNSYDYYWVVDEGSYFNGNIYDLIDKYTKDSSDLISQYMISPSPSWFWWNSKRTIKIVNKDHFKYSFISTCRFSRKLIECGHDSLSKNMYAYLEIFWPTICNINNLEYNSFDKGVIGDFKWKNKNSYIPQPQHIDNKLYFGVNTPIIPKIIHKTSALSKDEIFACHHFKKLINLHPEYTIKYYTNDDVEAYMKQHFDYDNIYEAYSNLVPWAYKIDIFRLCVLYNEGGIYSDIGHDMIVSFDTIIEEADFILCLDQGLCGQKGYIHNALMCTYPKNELFKIMLNTLVENIMNRLYNEDTLCITGPGALKNIIDIRNGYVKFTPYGQCKILHLQRKRKHLHCNIFDKKTNILLTKCDNYSHLFAKQQGCHHYSWFWENRKVYLLGNKEESQERLKNESFT